LSVYQKSEGWHIMSTFEDREGKIWLNGWPEDRQPYLCQALETGLRCYGSKEGFYAGFVAQDPSGDFWVAGNKTLVKWRPGARPQPVALPAAGAFDPYVLPESDGSAWVGITTAGRGGGLQRLTNGTLRPFRAPKLNGETIVPTVLQNDRQGNLWIGTNGQG